MLSNPPSTPPPPPPPKSFTQGPFPPAAGVQCCAILLTSSTPHHALKWQHIPSLCPSLTDKPIINPAEFKTPDSNQTLNKMSLYCLQVAKVTHSSGAGSVPDPQTSLQLVVQFETEYTVSVSVSLSGTSPESRPVRNHAPFCGPCRMSTVDSESSSSTRSEGNITRYDITMCKASPGQCHCPGHCACQQKAK